ncbi:hypothetical protein, partial [Bacteroides cellulosilyticus]|uniref:hypothetical protein n=1 Tax=Bacteroides cellulosilyticus TaxID=246787 RepID=UPI0032EDAD61
YARVCEAKGTVNLCTKCTNVRWNFGLIFSFTPHSSTRWMAVLICTSLCPIFSALLNNFSATCGLYFDERLMLWNSQEVQKQKSFRLIPMSHYYSH